MKYLKMLYRWPLAFLTMFFVLVASVFVFAMGGKRAWDQFMNGISMVIGTL